MKLTFSGSHFIAQGSFADKDRLKFLGFEWRPDFKAWVTENPKVAARLRDCADSEAKTKIEQSLIELSPWTGCIPYPKGLTPKPFQLKAAKWALERNRSYLALEQGLGKGIVEVLIMNAMKKHPVVILNQPGLCLNTEAEIQKWCTWKDVSPVVYGRDDNCKQPTEVLIVPDSLIGDPLGAHDKLRQTIHRMTAMGGATLFIDEAQRFNNANSQRSKALYQLAEQFDKVVFMSGTPMRNDRPIELYGILSRFAGETIGFMNESQYSFKYCAAYFDNFGRLKADGCSNEDELFSKVKEKFMHRVMKRDVLPELPPKTEEIVFIGESAPKAVTAFERTNLRVFGGSDTIRERITKSPHIATYRRMLGEAKADLAAKYIEEVLDSGDETLLVFAEHKKVVERLQYLLGKYAPLVVTGETSKKDKQWTVNHFQGGASRLFIGNTQACGVGFTLTRATRVIHVEPSWVPSDSDQASDRAHRIGQTEKVFVQYLVYRNSLDRNVVETQMRKRNTLRKL